MKKNIVESGEVSEKERIFIEFLVASHQLISCKLE
jgi:hypothetical protein